jgi:hypothetical protein
MTAIMLETTISQGKIERRRSTGVAFLVRKRWLVFVALSSYLIDKTQKKWVDRLFSSSRRLFLFLEVAWWGRLLMVEKGASTTHAVE